MDEYEYEYYSFLKNGQIQIRIVNIWILFQQYSNISELKILRGKQVKVQKNGKLW